MSAAPKMTRPERITRTTVDTIMFTQAQLEKLKSPPFQRPLKINAKVQELAETIRQDGGVIPGILTIGILGRDEYLLDGQHRRAAFVLSECPEGFADVRKRFFDSMAEMGEEFVNLNSQLVRLQADDVLRGLEGTLPGLALIKRKAPIVGYGYVRSNDTGPAVRMSTVISCLWGSHGEKPGRGTGTSVIAIAQALTDEDSQLAVEFLNIAEKAWGRDKEYGRLWGTLNLCVCMWLYRNLVVNQYSHRTPKVTKDQFLACLMSLSADAAYLQWLVGRNMSERDRSPAYGRIKANFTARLNSELGRKVSLPAPEWFGRGY